MDKEYVPERVEASWAEEWLRRQLFAARPESPAEPFCMVIPPPNVTGELHIGHVLVYTLHDVIARWRRMQGRDVLWLPGTDHAGIATQMVVERDLQAQGLDRVLLGREAFERRVWAWKETYGQRITDALKRLGASVDWSRERFTLDSGLSRAVRTVFVRLHAEGLIYRDRATVNWCPRCQTALSDLETVHQTVQGKLYTVLYAADAGSDTGLPLATTRPETLFGDTAVAVHPADERYRGWVGSRVRVPLSERTVPVVADAFVDPAFGTGAVKITPAHDPQDFQAARRLGLPEIEALDATGRMTAAAGRYQGLERFEARRRIVQDLAEAGLLLEVRDHEHAMGHCQRCSTPIEPRASTQWFVRMAPLAAPAIRAVEQGRVRFVPESWAKTYFEWMNNIHDWCISRQLWWGHRIPAWHCAACGQVQVAEEPPERCAHCGGALHQDEDVLDTWFSSALWPFSTLGWPEETRDLARYYPTDLLITGHDIIFFWVARMIMLGLKFLDEVPFREVYIHGLVRDAEGHKMSKTRGNTVVPSAVQERYGTDAVRFTMAMLAAPGNDIPLVPERMEGYRAFANKLWNASRFVVLKCAGATADEWRGRELGLADRWILSRLQATVAAVDGELAQYRFDRAAHELYHFVWSDFCDWYIEMAKPGLSQDEPSASRGVALHVMLEVLRLLHPFMPFVTEELWRRLGESERLLAESAWPRSEPSLADAAAERQVGILQELVVKIRNLRAESGIDPGRRAEVQLLSSNPAPRDLVERESRMVQELARASSVRIVRELPAGAAAARGVVGDFQIAVPLEGLVDLAAERGRLQRDLAKVEREIEGRARRLGDAGFISGAPAEVVERERRLHTELEGRRERLLAGLATLDPPS